MRRTLLNRRLPWALQEASIIGTTHGRDKPPGLARGVSEVSGRTAAHGDVGPGAGGGKCSRTIGFGLNDVFGVPHGPPPN